MNFLDATCHSNPKLCLGKRVDFLERKAMIGVIYLGSSLVSIAMLSVWISANKEKRAEMWKRLLFGVGILVVILRNF